MRCICCGKLLTGEFYTLPGVKPIGPVCAKKAGIVNIPDIDYDAWKIDPVATMIKAPRRRKIVKRQFKARPAQQINQFDFFGIADDSLPSLEAALQ
jgi:hypothetical protein